MLRNTKSWRPVFQWGRFAQSAQEGIRHLQTTVFPVIFERFDESLVLLRHQWGWSQESILYGGIRQAYVHGSSSSWPRKALVALNATLRREGDWDLYEAALTKHVHLATDFDSRGYQGLSLSTATQNFRDAREALASRCETNRSVFRSSLKALSQLEGVECSPPPSPVCRYGGRSTNEGEYVVDTTAFCAQSLFRRMQGSEGTKKWVW